MVAAFLLLGGRGGETGFRCMLGGRGISVDWVVLSLCDDSGVGHQAWLTTPVPLSLLDLMPICLSTTALAR
jgi:hypothetical protein